MRHTTAALAAATTLLLGFGCGQASATGYPIGIPTPVESAFSCRDFDSAGLLREFTVTPLPEGPRAQSDGTLSLATVYYETTDGWVLDWYQNSTGHDIHHVIIQAADGGHAYSYAPPVTSDRNLHGDAVLADGAIKPLYEPLRSATFCYSLPHTGTEGCTLGYWKVLQHHDSWPAGLLPGQSLQTVFGPNAYADTLLVALDYKGGPGVDGGKRLLLKQAVAALLNATSASVAYPQTRTQVIEEVRFALASGDRGLMLSLASTLDAYNNLGCPLN